MRGAGGRKGDVCMSETQNRMALRATELWDLSHTLARPWLEKTEYLIRIKRYR